MSSQDFTNDERFDGLYMNVANTARGIEPLLDTMFSFLRRKTDFFNGPHGQDASVAIAKVNEVLQKHVSIHEQSKREKEQAKKNKEEEAERKRQLQLEKEQKESKKNDENGVIEMGDDKGFDISSSSQKEMKTDKIDSTKTKDQDQTADISPVNDKEEAKADDDKEEDDGPAPLGNGGSVPGKYIWTQTLGEVNISIPLPENTRGRDLQVTIKKNYLSIALKSQLPSKIVDSSLAKTIICDDSFWTVEDGNKLVITLDKLNKMEWWECVCQGDPKIDVKKVQPENSKLDELDGDTRYEFLSVYFSMFYTFEIPLLILSYS